MCLFTFFSVAQQAWFGLLRQNLNIAVIEVTQLMKDGKLKFALVSVCNNGKNHIGVDPALTIVLDFGK